MYHLLDRLPVPVYPPALQVGDVLDFLPRLPWPSLVLARQSVAGGTLYRITVHNLARPMLFPQDQPLPLIYGPRTQEIQCARCTNVYDVPFDVAEATTAQLTCLVCAR